MSFNIWIVKVGWLHLLRVWLVFLNVWLRLPNGDPRQQIGIYYMFCCIDQTFGPRHPNGTTKLTKRLENMDWKSRLVVFTKCLVALIQSLALI